MTHKQILETLTLLGFVVIAVVALLVFGLFAFNAWHISMLR